MRKMSKYFDINNIERGKKYNFVTTNRGNKSFWIYKVFVTLHTHDKQVLFTCKSEQTAEAIKTVVKGICEATAILYTVSVVKEPYFMEDNEDAENSF